MLCLSMLLHEKYCYQVVHEFGTVQWCEFRGKHFVPFYLDDQMFELWSHFLEFSCWFCESLVRQNCLLYFIFLVIPFKKKQMMNWEFCTWKDELDAYPPPGQQSWRTRLYAADLGPHRRFFLARRRPANGGLQLMSGHHPRRRLLLCWQASSAEESLGPI